MHIITKNTGFLLSLNIEDLHNQTACNPTLYCVLHIFCYIMQFIHYWNSNWSIENNAKVYNNIATKCHQINWKFYSSYCKNSQEINIAIQKYKYSYT